MDTNLSREQIEAVIIDLMGENSKQFEKTEEEKKRDAATAQAEQDAAAQNGKPVNPLPQDQQFQYANAPIRR